METWIQQILNSNQAGYIVLIAVFMLGLISVFTCGCNFSIIAMVAGYSGTLGTSEKTKGVLWNGLLFLVGMMISMAVIGAVIGYASELISISFGRYWKIAAGVIAIFFGLYSMNLLPFKIPGISLNPSSRKKGTFASVVFGLTVGGLIIATSTCCNPVFPIILAASFVKGSMTWGILMMVVYALGYGITFTAILIGIGLGVGKTTNVFSKFSKVLTYLGGILMILIGFYLLITF